MGNCEGHILRAYIYHVFLFLNTYFEKGIACARGFIFDIEVDWDMIYFNGMFYHLKRDALVEGSTHFKEMHHSFSRELFKVF